ncbi:unnamed protein product [Timema podura]|uniref:Uncharacterized protein n=1 Tax=Timema podura TaxID=61482 RepID=A0ABN7NVU1_TIMPD|nr:unnamed protein product [Timema podura]
MLLYLHLATNSEPATQPTTPSTPGTTATTISTTTSTSTARSFPIQDKCRADDKVRCADGSIYICRVHICDGNPDCPQGDDEKDCPLDECATGEFMCDLTRCIPASKRCDSQQDCTDGTDEQECPTGINVKPSLNHQSCGLRSSPFPPPFFFFLPPTLLFFKTYYIPDDNSSGKSEGLKTERTNPPGFTWRHCNAGRLGTKGDAANLIYVGAARVACRTRDGGKGEGLVS